MAVAFRAAVAMNGTTNTTSGTVTIPAGVAAGDACFLVVVNRGATSAPSVTDDDTGGNAWTNIGGQSASGGHCSLWYKRATSATAGKTITVSGATDSVSATFDSYSGGLTSGDQFTNLSVEGNLSGNETAAGFTPTFANSMICFYVANVANDNATSAQTCTTPGALTERAEHLNTGGNDCATSVSSALQAGGPTVTGTFSWAQTNGVTVTFAFAVPPSVAPQEIKRGAIVPHRHLLTRSAA